LLLLLQQLRPLKLLLMWLLQPKLRLLLLLRLLHRLEFHYCQQQLPLLLQLLDLQRSEISHH
jgi:hypothetical protein